LTKFSPYYFVSKTKKDEFMLKQFKVFMTAVLILSSLSYSPRSEATVGLIIDSNATKWVGGGLTAAGVILFGIGYAAGRCAFGCDDVGELGIALTGLVYGVIIGGVGLIVLDEENAYPIEFVQLFPDELEDLDTEISYEEMLIYNDEVEGLNRLNQELKNGMADLSQEQNFQDFFSQKLQSFSSATQKVVQALFQQQM
jgi:hypothetical protein